MPPSSHSLCLESVNPASTLRAREGLPLRVFVRHTSLHRHQLHMRALHAHSRLPCDAHKASPHIARSRLLYIRLPSLYREQDPRFHASVCWWADGTGTTDAELAAIQREVGESDMDSVDLGVASITCKVGDRVYSIPLSL